MAYQPLPVGGIQLQVARTCLTSRAGFEATKIRSFAINSLAGCKSQGKNRG